MARLPMRLFVIVAVALVALSLAAGAHAQSYGTQNGGPIQFPPAPQSAESGGVVIGGSGFGFVPPQAGGGRGFNFGSRYRGGNSFGGSGGYRSSFGGPRFGGFDGYRGFGGFNLRGPSEDSGFFNHW